MKQIHEHRYDRSRQHYRKRKPAPPAQQYAPGHFTALIRQHNWPPMWQPAPSEPDTSQHLRALAIELRAQGRGWGVGTVVLPGTPTYGPPGFMERKT